MPRMSLSFMMSSSSPSILTSLPDHLPNKHPISDFDVQSVDFAGFVAGTWTDGDDLALLRLFLCGVGDDDPA